ncbi:hypothetical protein Pan97_08030 [Bremerella volcania]|uniref:Uncharacterized protein n=1 Tax=Bremerella volcania TaxID=2527984 RepID=A0A518C3L1_9BACT|nr:hypothetical protein [Bremerella volcania]QDU73803.1 hypothetical protein Pan97_08030 [Bremerella volcania]
MSIQRCLLIVGLLVLPILTSLGCSGENMVTLKISGTSTSEEREKISEKAKSLTDGSSNYITSYHMNNTYTVNVGPVTDVEAFVQQIDFGKVTKVEERTIYVDLDAEPDAEEPAATDPTTTDPAPMETKPMEETPMETSSE